MGARRAQRSPRICIGQNQSRCEELYGHELKDRSKQVGNPWLTCTHCEPCRALCALRSRHLRPSSFFPVTALLWACLVSPFPCVVWCQLLRRFLYSLSLGVYLLLNKLLEDEVCTFHLYLFLLSLRTVLCTQISTMCLLNKGKNRWLEDGKKEAPQIKTERDEAWESTRLESDLREGGRTKQKAFLFEFPFVIKWHLSGVCMRVCRHMRAHVRSLGFYS